MAQLDVTVSRTLIEEIDVLAEELEYIDQSGFCGWCCTTSSIQFDDPRTKLLLEGGNFNVSARRAMPSEEARERLEFGENIGHTDAHDVLLTEAPIESLENYVLEDSRFDLQ